MKHLPPAWRADVVAAALIAVLPIASATGRSHLDQDPVHARTFLGYQIGEERRYVLGPPESLARAEYALWSIRLESVSEDLDRGVFAYTHERSVPLPQSYANVHGPSVEVMLEGSTTVNAHGFPLVVEFTAEGSYYQLYDTSFWARYTFSDGRYHKQVRVQERDWEMTVPHQSHPGFDDSIPAGMFLFYPSDLSCMIPPFLVQQSDIGHLRIAHSCKASEIAFANPGLFSLVIPALRESDTGEGDFLFFSPIGPELYPGVAAGFAGPMVSNNMIGAGDPRNYFERMRIELGERETIEVGSRRPSAWRLIPDDGIEAIFVDDEGKVLRVDLGSRPPLMKESWIRLQFPSEY
jgi:hypothetical protein